MRKSRKDKTVRGQESRVENNTYTFEYIDENKNNEKIDFENLPYFHGKMTRDEAEDKLQGRPKGTFLTRFS